MAEGISSGEQPLQPQNTLQAERHAPEQNHQRLSRQEAAQVRVAVERAKQEPLSLGENSDEARYQRAMDELHRIQQSGEEILVSPATNTTREIEEYLSEREAQERKQALQRSPEIHPPEQRVQNINLEPALLQEAVRLAKMEKPPNDVDIDQFVAQRATQIYEMLKMKQGS